MDAGWWDGGGGVAPRALLLRWLTGFYEAAAGVLLASASVAGLARELWMMVRAAVLVPAVRCAVAACLVMSVMVMLEKGSMGAISLYAKLFRRRPHRLYRCEPLGGDEEAGSGAFPMVLVQIPMYNEKEVYKLSIGAACNLIWPEDRIVVQVLDDSTDPVVKVSQISMALIFGKIMKLTYDQTSTSGSTQ